VYEEDSSVEDDEVEAELQEERGEASVGDKSGWGLNVQETVGMPTDLLD
jgi:hypothetical protein